MPQHPGKQHGVKGMGRMSKKPTKPSTPQGGKDYLKEFSEEDFNRGYRKP